MAEDLFVMWRWFAQFTCEAVQNLIRFIQFDIIRFSSLWAPLQDVINLREIKKLHNAERNHLSFTFS